MEWKEKPIRIEWQYEKWVWVCKHHKTELFGAGHSVGRGVECFEGMMFDKDESCWHPDASEMWCPKLKGDPTDEEMEQCMNSWELVKEASSWKD
jgi:hypothetical protein